MVVASIKVLHTIAWLSIESCVVYVLYAGFAPLLVLMAYLHARSFVRAPAPLASRAWDARANRAG